MPVPDDHLRRAVDEVLEPVWPAERRRASRRWLASTLGRAGAGILGFWGLGLVVSLVRGAMLPWTFFVFVGGLTLGAALHNDRHPAHLQRDPGPTTPAGPRAYRPCPGLEPGQPGTNPGDTEC